MVSATPNAGKLTDASNHQTGAHLAAAKPHANGKTTTTILKAPVKVVQHVNTPRRASKPIINWLQRKLAGKTKRAADKTSSAASDGKRAAVRGASNSLPARTAPRAPLSPLPPASASLGAKHIMKKYDSTRRKTISLNGDDDGQEFSGEEADDNNSLDRSSFARDSMWSPTSALEADEDASVRPLPPSVPPSPSPSRSSSSYLSDPRTFRSIAASTKPTTLLSIDLNTNGMAHIAQAPLTPPSQVNRFSSHARSSSQATNSVFVSGAASVTFSPFPQSSSRPSSLSIPSTAQPTNGTILCVQAPLHTTHHPRNNPRPSSPPPDNASVLTLASSAYAIPGLRPTGIAGYHSSTPSGRGVGDSLSRFEGSVTYADAESASQFLLGDELEERDVDASVRALRPRSSRRGSWESEASGWSARVQPSNGTASLVRERSVWTTNSVGTGGLSTENGEAYDRSEYIVNGDEPTDENTEAISNPSRPQSVVSLSAASPVSPTLGDASTKQDCVSSFELRSEASVDSPKPEALTKADSVSLAHETDGGSTADGQRSQT